MVVTLVLGGARSGKSEAAEAIAMRSQPPVTYLATGTADDDDMSARIAEHRSRRPADWSTVELGRSGDLRDALSRLEGTVLIDSLGTWLAAREGFVVDAEELCAALAGRPGHTIVVSDEVGLGVHPSSDAGRRFRDALGSLNQQVAATADAAVLVVAGRVLQLGAP